MRALWEDRPDGASFHGEFFDFDHAMCYPKPMAGPRTPIHIGGHSRAAARRAGRLGDGLQPLGVGGPELTELISVMREEATKVGPRSRCAGALAGHLVAKIDGERAEKLASLGADRLVLAMPPTTDLEQAKDLLSACADRLALKT